MMNSIMSVVFASDNEYKMNELTIHRTIASLPFGGRYRFIDFTLSNLVNSNITTIGIITRSNYSSLMDHIRMGRDWDLNRKNSGIAVFPPYVSNTVKSMQKGKIEALYGIRDYLLKSKEEYVLITNSNIAANIDYDDVFDFHIGTGADLTVLTHMAKTTTSRRVVIDANEKHMVKEVLLSFAPGEEEKELSLNIYLIKKDLLISILDDCYAHSNFDFEKDVLQKMCQTLKIAAYKTKGYSAIIDDIKSYYRESMKLLDGEIRNDLFHRNGKIFTKVKDSVPTVYREKAQVKNGLIADGCDINGRVENSILFRGVKVEEGAIIKNSIVMEGGVIMRGSSLNYTITDKNVTIRENRDISGFETYPVAIVKGKEV